MPELSVDMGMKIVIMLENATLEVMGMDFLTLMVMMK